MWQHPPSVSDLKNSSAESLCPPRVPHSFYRYVLEPEVLFQADGSFSAGPMAKFLDMPQSPLFTLNLNTPESWMVESVNTRYDLDNIYLNEVGKQLSDFQTLILSFFRNNSFNLDRWRIS